MGWTNFPHGITSLGMPVIGAGPILTTGRIYFVDSNADKAANRPYPWGQHPDEPFATLDYAVGQCRANKGDHIIVNRAHAETITGAGGITFDVAGITVIGLGTYNQRPRFLMDGAATVTALITAADVTLRNLVFAAGHADIVAGIGVTARGAWLDQLEFVNNVVDENFLTPIKATSTTDNNADGIKITDCRWYSVDAASLEFFEYNADILGATVVGNYVVHEGTASPLILGATGKDLHYHNIQWNFLSHKMTANELLININTAANPGIIAHNRVRHADVTTTHDLGIDGLGSALFDNLSVSVDNLSGLLLPAADVNS